MKAGVKPLALCCAGVFGGAFLATVLLRTPAPEARAETPDATLARWLGLDDQAARTLRERDPEFSAELQGLRDTLDKARAELADIFERPEVAPDLLRRQAETVIAAHNAVERRVLEYLLAVRDRLTPAQQKRLFELCAENVRTCKQRQWGQRGHQRGAAGSDAEHTRHGRGPCDLCGRGQHRDGAGADAAAGVRTGRCEKCGRGGRGGGE